MKEISHKKKFKKPILINKSTARKIIHRLCNKKSRISNQAKKMKSSH